MEMIEVYDSFFEEELHKKVVDFCFSAGFCLGEADSPDTPPVGMSHNLSPDSSIYDDVQKTILEKCPDLKELTLSRMYINLFHPMDNPFFHIDSENSDDVTLLYYPNIYWNLQEGGETQFLIDNKLTGIAPMPNRMVKFKSDLVHRATTFRSSVRFTLAVKYKTENLVP